MIVVQICSCFNLGDELGWDLSGTSTGLYSYGLYSYGLYSYGRHIDCIDHVYRKMRLAACPAPMPHRPAPMPHLLQYQPCYIPKALLGPGLKLNGRATFKRHCSIVLLVRGLLLGCRCSLEWQPLLVPNNLIIVNGPRFKLNGPGLKLNGPGCYCMRTVRGRQCSQNHRAQSVCAPPKPVAPKTLRPSAQRVRSMATVKSMATRGSSRSIV